MNIESNKPINNILKYTIVFYEEEAKPILGEAMTLYMKFIMIQKME